jgi:hypothetical protein
VVCAFADTLKSQRSARRIWAGMSSLPPAAGWSIWSRPIILSGVPWWVMTCVAPGRFTTALGQFTLLISQRARATAR